jgi:hypothetical protein
MWFYAVLALGSVLVLSFLWWSSKIKASEKISVSFLLMFGIGGLGYGGMYVVKATGGMLPDYSEGVRTGYLTKISKKGVFWKTWEAEMQVGAGEQAAIQQPWHFSIAADDLAEKVRTNLGKKVMVEYKEWILMPYSIGDSGYVADKIQFEGPAK